LSYIASAQQFSSQVFHEGYLVTIDQDTVKGLLKYDMETNIVQLVQGNVVKTYSSHNIYHFEIYDQLVNNYRQFYSIPYNVNYDYKTPIFFEVLYEGPLSLLCREAIVQVAVNNGSAMYWGSNYMQNRLQYTYFFLDKQGNIQLYTGKKASLLSIMSKHASQVKSFIKKNRLKPDEMRDIIRITAFYNAI